MYKTLRILLTATLLFCVAFFLGRFLFRSGVQRGVALSDPLPKTPPVITYPAFDPGDPLSEVPVLVEGRMDSWELGTIHPYYPRLKERSAGEWQGMLIDMAEEPPCESSNDCSLARACLDGKCTGCSSDAECLGHERCVLDHCVLVKLVSCTTSRDCTEPDGVCILSGYSYDRRGNADMRSFCPSAETLANQQFSEHTPEAFIPTGSSATSRIENLLRDIEWKQSP